MQNTFEVLDELDRANSERSGHLGFHWTNTKDAPKGDFREYRQKTFLAAAIQARLPLYVEEKLRQNPSLLRQKRGRPLLDYALRPDMVTPLTIETLTQPPVVPIVKLLLELGADPNAGIYVYDGKTPWYLFLVTCWRTGADKSGDSRVNEIAEAMHLMLSYGAKGDDVLEPIGQQHISTVDIAESHKFSSFQKARIEAQLKKNAAQGNFLSRLTAMIW